MVSTDVEARELARLKKLMKNPSYWRDRNPAIVKAVTKGFEDLYDYPKQSESEASKLKDLPEARQGQMANI
ncbi:hypothetical protein [Curvivirga aplysinae]|uniref:hypothetical protein n=1 Tax=Curvivirga aplysinae TaxID=2529852 RepID=UPI0012BB7F3E|nr:hypothetical protein [Curvivirga aplysinae]MTI08612.1 hypothetical protein [Curvivirga aplysinae]